MKHTTLTTIKSLIEGLFHDIDTHEQIEFINDLSYLFIKIRHLKMSLLITLNG